KVLIRFIIQCRICYPFSGLSLKTKRFYSPWKKLSSKKRFDNYGKYGLPCGADGPAHLIVNRDRRPETRGIGESLKHQEFFSCTSRDGSGSNRSCQSSLRCQNPVESGEQCGDLDNGRRHQFYCLLTHRCWRV
ncbi:unnamed protein product, partial [Brassica rapa]